LNLTTNRMKYFQVSLMLLLVGVIIMSLITQEASGHVSRPRKIRILKKLGALALLHKKKVS